MSIFTLYYHLLRLHGELSLYDIPTAMYSYAYVEQGHSREAVSLSSGQDICHLLQNTNVLTMFTKAYPLFPILRQMIHVHNIMAHSFWIHFNYFLTFHQHF
jgi:hypothetical protein